MLVILINFAITALIVYLIVKAVKNRKSNVQNSGCENQNNLTPNPAPPINETVDKIARIKWYIADQYVGKIRAKFPGIMDDFSFERFIDESADPEKSEEAISDLASDHANPGSLCVFFDKYGFEYKIKNECRGDYWNNISSTILERVAATYRSTRAYEILVSKTQAKIASGADSLIQKKLYYLNCYADLIISNNYDGYVAPALNDPDLEDRKLAVDSYHNTLVKQNVSVAEHLIACAYGNKAFTYGKDIMDLVRENANLAERVCLDKALALLQTYFFTEHDLFNEDPRVGPQARNKENRESLVKQESTLAVCYYLGLGIPENRDHASAFYQRVKRFSEETAQKIAALCPSI